MDGNSMIRVGAVILFFLLTAAAKAQLTVPDGDYYIRALDPSGDFSGIQEILNEPRDGYYKAVYCERAFWVTLSTVKWTEQEAEAGRHLVIINDANRKIEIVCVDPERYVQLKDIAPAKKPLLRKDVPNVVISQPKAGRLRDISKAFRDSR